MLSSYGDFAYIGLIFCLGMLVGCGCMYFLRLEIEERDYKKKAYYKKRRQQQQIQDLKEDQKRRQLYQIDQWRKEMESPETKTSKLEIKKLVQDKDGKFLGACRKVV